MKPAFSLSLIISLILSSILPVYPSLASELDVNESSEILLARGRGGGRRGGRSINHNGLGSGGSGRVNRDGRRRVNTEGRRRVNTEGRRRVNTEGYRRIDSPSNRPPGNRPINRPDNGGSFDRKRDINLDSRHRNTNRINRNIINNGNIVVNPRPGWGGWGWNGGSRWYPNYGYWGGGFWGGFAAGALTVGITSAIVNSSSSTTQTNYVIIEKNTPGYYLFDSYGLTQVQCDSSQNLVFIYGPQDSLMCATPNSTVVAGYYDVDPEDLVLVVRE